MLKICQAWLGFLPSASFPHLGPRPRRSYFFRSRHGHCQLRLKRQLCWCRRLQYSVHLLHLASHRTPRPAEVCLTLHRLWSLSPASPWLRRFPRWQASPQYLRLMVVGDIYGAHMKVHPTTSIPRQAVLRAAHQRGWAGQPRGPANLEAPTLVVVPQ
jgi:hypothetical protein